MLRFFRSHTYLVEPPHIVTIHFEPNDMWVGLFRKSEYHKVEGAKWEAYEIVSWYVCILPMLPVKMTWVYNVPVK